MTSTLPDFQRLRYFHGQMLAARDFQDEQAYFVEKLKLRNRCLHGYGVVCGLRLHRVEARDPCDDEEEDGQPRVTLEPGIALDCQGNEIVVGRECALNLWSLLSERDRSGFCDGASLYVSIEYCEWLVEPLRGVFTDRCGDVADCEYGRTKESYRIHVTLKPPTEDDCVDVCCGDCADRRLLLARIDGSCRGQPVVQSQIHLEVRRPLSRYRYTTITGISWEHGAKYTAKQAGQILGRRDGSRGLVVHFSKPVHTRCLVDGVVDVQVIQGGLGAHAGVYFIDGKFEPLPHDEFTDRFRWRQTSRETLQEGDRVLITVRTPFILDRCCRPVDGTHVGGRVPLLPEYKRTCSQPDFCTTPPWDVGPWTSGTGTGAGVFESWFFVAEDFVAEESS